MSGAEICMFGHDVRVDIRVDVIWAVISVSMCVSAAAPAPWAAAAESDVSSLLSLLS